MAQSTVEVSFLIPLQYGQERQKVRGVENACENVCVEMTWLGAGGN